MTEQILCEVVASFFFFYLIVLWEWILYLTGECFLYLVL